MFKGFTVRRLYKSFGVKELKITTTQQRPVFADRSVRVKSVVEKVAAEQVSLRVRRL
jgi:hypothetical protein